MCTDKEVDEILDQIIDKITEDDEQFEGRCEDVLCVLRLANELGFLTPKGHPHA